MKKIYHYEQEHPFDSLPMCLWEANSQTCDDLVYYNVHKEIEFIHVVKGTFQLSIDEKPVLLHENEIGIINTNQMHYGIPLPNEVCEIRTYVFDFLQLCSQKPQTDPAILTALTQEQLWFPSKLYAHEAITLETIALLDQLACFWHKRSPGYEIKLKALLYELLFLFCTHNAFLYEREWGTLKSVERKKNLLSLLAFLDKHYSEKISVLRMADVLYMGTDTFYKFIVSMTGMAPITFLRQFRLKKAAELLSDTTLTVTEICFNTGFSNISYFIRCFRAAYGYTPHKYREHVSK